MHETISPPPPPSVSVAPGTKKRLPRWLKISGLVVASLLLLSLLGYGAYYAWDQVQSLRAEVASKNTEIQHLKRENTALKKEDTAPAESTKEGPTNSSATQTLSETLPNGKKVRYPLSEANAQIIWWHDEADDAETVAISDKRMIAFLASQDVAVLQSICELDDVTTSGAAVGIFNLKQKTFQNNQYANCVALLADPEYNDDAGLRTAAKQVLDTATANVKRFIAESVI